MPSTVTRAPAGVDVTVIEGDATTGGGGPIEAVGTVEGVGAAEGFGTAGGVGSDDGVVPSCGSSIGWSSLESDMLAGVAV